MKTHMDGHGLRKPSQLGTPAGVEREPSGRRISIGKLRLDRGPLRWWLIVSGVLFVQFSARRSALGVVLLIAYQQISRRRSEISSRAWSMLTEIGRTIRRLILDG